MLNHIVRLLKQLGFISKRVRVLNWPACVETVCQSKTFGGSWNQKYDKERPRTRWAARILYRTQKGQHSSPTTPTTGVFSSQTYTDKRRGDATLWSTWPCLNYFEMLLPSNSKLLNFFLKIVNVISLNVWYVSMFYCEEHDEIGKSLFFCCCFFYTASKLFRNWGCICRYCHQCCWC